MRYDDDGMRQVMLEIIRRRREPEPEPEPAMSGLEKVAAAVMIAAAVGAKFVDERAKRAALAPPTPRLEPTPAPAVVPVAAAAPASPSWATILMFVAPLAAGAGAWIAHLWGTRRALEERERIAATVAWFDQRHAEFRGLIRALRDEVDGYGQRVVQLERREDRRDALAAQAERAREWRAREAELQRDQEARAADERRDRRAEQLEARRSEGYVDALAHNTRELARVLAEERAKLDKMNAHVEWMEGLRRAAPTVTEARALDEKIVDAKQEVQAIYDDLDYLSSLC